MLNIYVKAYEAMVKEKEYERKIANTLDEEEIEILKNELRDVNYILGQSVYEYHNIIDKMKEQNLSLEDINKDWIIETFKDIWMYGCMTNVTNSLEND